METFLAFFDRLFVWVPRVELIRSTHGGVKWRSHIWKIGSEPDVVELKPGLHWYWPVTTEICFVVTARQPTDITPMSILTFDGQSIVISASVIFRVNDVVKAIGEKNWDVDAVVVDITQGIIFHAVRSKTFEDLCQNSDQLIEELTENAKNELRKFGILVERVLLKDFDRSKTFRMLGETVSFLDQESVDSK